MHPAAGLALLLIIGLVLALSALTAFVGFRLRRPPRKTYARAVAKGLPGDPEELDRPRHHRSYTLQLAAGRRTYAAPVWAIDGDDPVGPVIIVTLGWADSRIGALVRLGDADHHPGLATHASTVLAWDPPGQGEGTGTCPLGTREPDLINRLIDHAIEQHDALERGVILHGSSLGAGASIVAASIADGPQRDVIAGVIAEAPYRVPVPPARNVVTQAGYPAFTLPPLYLYFGVRLGVGLGENWGRAHGGIGFDRARHAARLACPLLVVHGDADAVSPFDDGHAIADAAPDGRLLRLEHAGHNNLWTDQRFAPTIGLACADFIDQHRRAKAPSADAAHAAQRTA